MQKNSCYGTGTSAAQSGGKEADSDDEFKDDPPQAKVGLLDLDQDSREMLQTRALLRTAALIRHTKPQLMPCPCWLPHPATFSTSHRLARPSPSLEDIDDAADRRQSSALPLEERTRPKGKAKTPPKHRKRKELPELNEEDLEESFVRGKASLTGLDIMPDVGLSGRMLE